MSDAVVPGGQSASRRRLRPRSPGVVYSTAALVLALVIAVIAAQPSLQPPPAISEFAPTAREQIKDAPIEQTSEFGSGEGGAAGSEGGTTTTTTTPATAGPGEPPKVIDKARVRRCVGDPPRQIEDPQSPPCVAYWEGTDNGGATSQGVTGNEIRVAVPYIESGPAQGEASLTPSAVALQDFFNRRFEFYGRKIKLVKMAGKTPDNGNPEPARQKADAVHVDQQIQAFASLPNAAQGGADFYYHDELTRLGVVSVYSGWGTAKDEPHFASKHPYQWNIMPGGATIAANLGEWMCNGIAGRPVQKSPQFNGQQRVYGVVLGVGPEGTRPDIRPMLDRFRACGINIKATVEIPYESAGNAALVGMLRLQQEGVTTAISFLEAAPLDLFVLPIASTQGYRPEWVLTSFGNQTEDSAGLLSDRGQLQNAFGLTFLNKNVPPADFPMNWAVKEIDPNLDGDWANVKYLYWPLLILASGIQAAGPNLTPQTFGDALLRLKFPNPGAGGPPFYQATVGFGPDDHTFFSDGTPVWWNGEANSYQLNSKTGTFCYVDHGTRYPLGGWPQGPPGLFAGSCY